MTEPHLRVRGDPFGHADPEVEASPPVVAQPGEEGLLGAGRRLQPALPGEWRGGVGNLFLLVVAPQEEVGVLRQVRQPEAGGEAQAEVAALVGSVQHAHIEAAIRNLAAVTERAVPEPAVHRACQPLRRRAGSVAHAVGGTLSLGRGGRVVAGGG